MKRSMSRGQAGFTLLEAVVTLVVVSMLMALLMQALSQSLGLRTRLLRLYGESRQMLLQEAWFRENIATAQPPTIGTGDAFEGAADSVSFISAVPLVTGGSGRVRWWLAQDEGGGMSLNYSDSAVKQLVIVKGPLRDARFSYASTDEQWMQQWRGEVPDPAQLPSFDAQQAPGEPAAPPPPPILPRLLRFQAVTAQGRQLDWVVHLPSDLRPVDQNLGFRELIGGQ